MTLELSDNKLRELICEILDQEMVSRFGPPRSSAPPQNTDDPLLTVPEAARMLGMSRAWVYEKSNDGTLPCRRFGSAIRFDRAELQAFRDKGNRPRLP